MFDPPVTDAKKYHFKVSEFGNGHVYISTEPMGDRLQILKDSNLYFILPDGATHAQAQEIAEFLNKHISAIAVTTNRGS